MGTYRSDTKSCHAVRVMRQYIAENSGYREKQMRVMFGSFFRRPIVERAYAEAKNGPLK